MSVHKSNLDTTKHNPGPSKAPVPQVDREHLGEMRRIERESNFIAKIGKK